MQSKTVLLFLLAKSCNDDRIVSAVNKPKSSYQRKYMSSTVQEWAYILKLPQYWIKDDRSEWSASRPGLFTAGKIFPYLLNR